MTQNEHVCVICCRSEAAGDVIYGENVNTIECDVCYILKFLTLVVSKIFENIHFVTAEAAPAETDIDDSIKRKRIRVSLKNRSDCFRPGVGPLEKTLKI